jgi:hypothetical protein
MCKYEDLTTTPAVLSRFDDVMSATVRTIGVVGVLVCSIRLLVRIGGVACEFCCALWKKLAVSKGEASRGESKRRRREAQMGASLLGELPDQHTC